MQTPRTEFAQALRAVAEERGLNADVIIETIKQAIVAAYRRDARERGDETEEFDYDVELDSRNGEAKIFSFPAAPKEIVDEVETLKEETEEEKKERMKDKKDVTPPGFGRIAAQTAKQVIHQKIREAEKEAILGEFGERVGNLVSGMILRFDGPSARVDIGRTEAIMPGEERIPTERLNPNQRLTFLLKEIKDTPRGREIILSRADPTFVEKLFAREVPEIASGSVVVKKIAREPGIRTKIVVQSSQPGVDPVGSCVGQKGVRVQAVTNELGGERVDIIPWSEDVKELLKSSLSPAENMTVTLDEKSEIAKVEAPEDQLSLIIGREGQNVRLAAKLTGWKIEVVGIPVPESEKEKEPEAEIEKAEKKEDVTEDKQADQKEEKAKETVDETVKDEKVAEEPEKPKEGVKPEEPKEEIKEVQEEQK